ncbi:hypothetical protein GYMLUDRAFT_41354 [Collybiopsis luxurians FD-317 M1]|uniref:Sodium/calcium exchanger membrane region domain-containing protein n=1 Tax=Collybiopsis luxurians FD-317 M1 TaxID=944289 RepID=A0A0D0C4K3_9AGAR|nr:hypothetical protein GYMLUDRAFT_41354 [Collybiopsis luxurians FD-317 M1]
MATTEIHLKHTSTASYSQPQLPGPALARMDTNYSTISTMTSESRVHLVDRTDTQSFSTQSTNKKRYTLPLFRGPSSSSGYSRGSSGDVNSRFHWRDLFKGWRLLLFGSWFNVLLCLIPVACTFSLAMEEYHGLVFIFCLLALLPLVKMHEVTTRELSQRIGGSKTGLLNASLLSALRKCELHVVQSSLIGSILGKLLLVLGLCFFAGGLKFSEQVFDATANQIHSSLLSISVGVLLLPMAYHFAMSGGRDDMPEYQRDNILNMSHAVSLILLTIYVFYLVFQLVSHTHLYQDSLKKSRRLSLNIPAPNIQTPAIFQTLTFRDKAQLQPGTPYISQPSGFFSISEITLTDSTRVYPPAVGDSTVRLIDLDTTRGMNSSSRLAARSASGASDTSLSGGGRSFSGSTINGDYHPGLTLDTEDLNQEKFTDIPLSESGLVSPGASNQSSQEPRLSWFLTILSLVCVTVGVAFIADWMVEAMDGISATIRGEWIALVLLPAVTSIAECGNAIGVSVKDQVTLSISVAVGSSIQTALFVIPLMVTISWAMGKPLSLLFDPFQSLVLYLSVQTMTHVVGDGKSNWLEGAILISLYVVIAVSFWFYPGSNLQASLAVCTPN